MFELKKIVVFDDSPEILYYECEIVEKESGECIVAWDINSKSWDQNWQKRLGDSEISEIQDLINEGDGWINIYYQNTIKCNNPEEFKELDRKMCENATHYLKMYCNSENSKRNLIPADEIPDFEVEKMVNGTYSIFA